MQKPPDEAPRANRFRTGLSAKLHYGSETVDCDVSNLSRTGVFLAGSFPRSVEGRVHLTLKSPSGDLEVRMGGRAVRYEPPDANGVAGLAIELDTPEGVEKTILESLLSRAIGGSNPSPLQSLRQGMPLHELRKALEAIPLADRIAAATRAGPPREREVLRYDSHPLVLQALQRNTSLSLDDARALAAAPHAPAALLEALARDSRFGQDDELKVILLSHPQFPAGAADALLASMRLPLVRKLLGRPTLSAMVRAKVTKKVRQSS